MWPTVSLISWKRGVYEFAPGAHAGPYGHGDPFIDLRAALSAGYPLSVALQSALWLYGMAERAPDRHELAAPPGSAVPVSVRRRMRVVRFSARLPTAQVDRLPVHQAATILVHAAARPGDVLGWTTLAEALPELAAQSTADDLDQELSARPRAVRPRLAYLLSGVAPAVADWLQPTTPSSVTWFGSSRTSRRYDKRFNVADSLLPFDHPDAGGARMSRITTGWLARHTPQGPGGRQAALIDIAQDLLLARLCERGVFDHLVFKGGTALRKLYAGNAGRFSTDLDFSVRNPDDEPEAVAELLRGEIDGQDIDGFRYFVEDHRGRAQVRYETPFGGVGNLTTKLDVVHHGCAAEDRGYGRVVSGVVVRVGPGPGCRNGRCSTPLQHPSLLVLVRGRPTSCDTIRTAQVVHLPT